MKIVQRLLDCEDKLNNIKIFAVCKRKYRIVSKEYQCSLSDTVSSHIDIFEKILVCEKKVEK